MDNIINKIDRIPYFVSNGKDFILYQGNSLELLDSIPKESVDLIFADPPYNLSNGGFTVNAGKRVSVNKGDWDKSN